jgi:hypothetical protein
MVASPPLSKRASKKEEGKPKPDIFEIFHNESNNSAPPKGRPQAKTKRRGQRKKLKGYDLATQASRSTEASADNPLRRKEEVIFFLVDTCS